MKGVSLDQILLDLKDDDTEIKRMAAQALLHQAVDHDELIRSVIKRADDETLEAVYGVLFDADGDFSSIFMEATTANDPRVRRMAIRYIFRKGRFCLEDGLRWLRDGDPYVRRRVINYISWINESGALKPISDLAVNDPDTMVRIDALKVIAVWGDAGDAERIIKALEDEDHEVKSQAIYTLSRITGEDFGDPMGSSEDELEWIVAKWQAWWEIMKEGA